MPLRLIDLHTTVLFAQPVVGHLRHAEPPYDLANADAFGVVQFSVVGSARPIADIDRQKRRRLSNRLLRRSISPEFLAPLIKLPRIDVVTALTLDPGCAASVIIRRFTSFGHDRRPVVTRTSVLAKRSFSIILRTHSERSFELAKRRR